MGRAAAEMHARETWSAAAGRLDALDGDAYCRAILPHVSRTFALTIPYLPAPLDHHVGVGYLLCRMADTIEDEPAWSGEARARAFDLLATAVAAPEERATARALADAANSIADGDCGAESTDHLLQRAESVLGVFASFPPQTRAPIADCVTEMISGMRRTPAAREGEAVRRVCASIEELEQYCHYVAGVVGIMLTRLFDVELGAAGAFATPARIEQGRRFGLGLQLTNILVDQAADADRGKRYLPGDDDTAVIGRAVEHLRQALDYSLAIPADREGIRAFCLLPLFFALRTLRAVVRHPRDATLRPKITREEVAEITAAITSNLADDASLRARFAHELQEIPDGRVG